MNKTVLITGANHGLGLSLTEVFLDNGCTVFAGVYKRNEASQINRIQDRDNLHIFDIDISDTGSIDEAARFVGERAQSIDILVNNAGMIPRDEIRGPKKTILDRLDFDLIRESIDVNALGALRATNIFADLLMRGGDKLVVNISSEAGSISSCFRDEWFGYCMSKAALNMAGAIMHNGLKERGGQVLQIHPGYMKTYMSGEKNEEATYTPDFSAENIFRVIRNAKRYSPDRAVFTDLFGNEMEW